MIDEIHNVRSNRHLAVKLETTQTAVAQSAPKFPLSRSRFTAHPFGAGIGERGWVH